VHQLTARIDRPLDLNAPAALTRTVAGQMRTAAAADASRPIVPVANGYRRIVSTVNDGLARYDGLHVNLRRRMARGASFLASYTWSHAINTVEPDVPNQDPNDVGLLGRAERASSLLDQRHRAVLSGWWDLPEHFTFGGIMSLASGRPFNITTGVDNNGDSSNTDRPVVNGALLGRNAGRGTPVYDVQMFLQREFAFAGDRVRFRLRAESFNALNHSNIVGRNAIWGNADTPLPAFGQALGGVGNVDPGRQFQFSAAVRF